jgi:hypothetical protein
MSTEMGRADRPKMTFAATIISKAESKDGPALEIEIPAFGSQYPTKLTRVPPALSAELSVGWSYNLVLERQNKKPNQSGDQYYHYYWGLMSIAGEDAETTLADVGLSGGDSQAQPHAQPRERGWTPPRGVDPVLASAKAKQDSIEAQKSLELAWNAALQLADGDSTNNNALFSSVRENFFFSLSLLQESREQVSGSMYQLFGGNAENE